tara:strand:- start:10193 stop:11182 length:990 start_codon:yes stop_codon:yes gene_type:complete
MTVRQRGKGWQVDVFANGKRARRNFDLYEDALAWEKEAKQSLKIGRPLTVVNSTAKVNGWTLKDAAERTFVMRWENSKSEKTHLINMRKNLEYFGNNCLLTDITTERVDDLILHLKSTRLSGSTINRVLMNLSRILRTAREYNKMTHHVFIHRQPEGEHRLRWLTEEEMVMMTGLAADMGYVNLHDAMIVAVDTGVRRSELMRIKKADITAQGLGVWESKAQLPRIIPLTKRARAVLENRTGDPFMFPQKEFIRSAFERVKHHCGLGNDVVWHTLRHTFASRLVQRNVPIQVVQKLMGHKTIQITMRYAKINDTNMVNAISVLDNLSTE